MTITAFIEKLKTTPKTVSFQETMQVIEDHYDFEPTSFTNGEITNNIGQNSGSCKLFAFAKLQQLNSEETLHCFGNYYTDVLNTPAGNDHQNIRNFMKTGWNGISFSNDPLLLK